ncbi:MAG TPA: hypothetical protein VI504_09660 [Candidatus Eisenbacteria bacterium]|jgi:hypothetical protein
MKLPRLLAFAMLAALSLAPLRVRAETTEARLDEVEKKLDAALAEIERLKLGGAAPETTAAYASRHGFAPGASRVYDASGGASLGGYGEMLFAAPDRTHQNGTLSGARPTLDLLRAVFYVGHKFTPTLLFNSELEWEHGGVLDEGEASVDPASGAGTTELSGEATVEFAYLDWRVRPSFGVRAGKLLVPMGLVNEQHEPPVFYGARRPDTESLVIPSTWTAAGAGFYGETAAGLEWRAYAVEGLDARRFAAASAIREGRQGAAQALVTHPAFTARVDWKGTNGLTLGASGYTGDAWQEANPAGVHLSARVTLADAHVRWQWRGLELRGLAVNGRLADAGVLSDALALTGAERLGERFFGGYAEAAYDVAPRAWPGTEWSFTPYARAETLDTQDGVPGGVDTDASEHTVFTFGVAVKPHPNVVVKADREQRSRGAGLETGQWNVALGWLF